MQQQPPRALPTDTSAPPRRRQPPIPLRRRRGLPETPRPLRRRSSLPETPGRYGTAAAMTALSYSRRLAQRRPRFLLGAVPAEETAATVLSSGVACTESPRHTKATRCKLRCIVKALFLRSLLKYFHNSPTASYKISLSRTLATTAWVLLT